MNAIDRWKIADRLTERARYDNMMLVTEAIDECVKIVDELVRKKEPLSQYPTFSELARTVELSPEVERAAEQLVKDFLEGK